VSEITPIVDVVQRLRIHAEAIEDCTPVPYQKMAEVQALAADEIERLRQRVLELRRPPRGIGGQIVTVADGCPTYGDLLDAYYRTENEYIDHFAKLWQRIKEQDAGIELLSDLLGEVVDWLGVPGWAGPQLPDHIARRIAEALGSNGSGGGQDG